MKIMNVPCAIVPDFENGVVLNRESDKSNNVEISLKELGFDGSCKLLDVYTKEHLGKVRKSISFKVGPKSGKFLFISNEN